MTLRSISSAVRVDLDSPVHGAGMHDRRVGHGDGEFFAIEPEERKYSRVDGTKSPASARSAGAASCDVGMDTVFIRWWTSTPNLSIAAGSRVLGATNDAPMVFSR